jgi:hypothetical protein
MKLTFLFIKNYENLPRPLGGGGGGGWSSVLFLQFNLPGSELDFFLSKITRPWWLELPIARTDFDSPFEFEPAKFYSTIF